MSEIIDKLRKLQALSERAGTEQEAALASMRIRELLDKHNLDIGVLELQQEEGIEAPAGQKKRKVPEHWPILAHATKETCDVDFFTRGNDRSGWQFCFVGLKANVQTATVMFAYLIDSVEDLLDTWKHEPDSLFGRIFREYSKKDYRAFRLGVAKRIYEEIMLQKLQSERQATPQSQELVHVGTAIAKRMMDSMTFENVAHYNTKVNRTEALSYQAGYSRGDQVDPHGAGEKRIRRGR